ncbi:MAG: phosphotransferase enzyme family protein [Actinomycetota bacterium]
MRSALPESLLAAARGLVESQYRLSVANFTHLATHSNVLFRVDLSDGRRLVLRVGQPLSSIPANLQIEVAWLSSLVADTRLNLAEPIATPDGRRVVELGEGDTRRGCVLFTWVPGEPLGRGAGTSGYRAMGRISALLHRHGSWRPPSGLELRRWDRTFYYPEELDPNVVEDFRYDHLFSGLRPLIRRTAAMCDDFITGRWAEGTPMVVHGDLHEWNVHLYMGRAWAIDFEDVMLALPAQDIAVSLYGTRTRDDLDSMVAAFREGYEEHGIWPVRDRAELEAYWAARQVMLMNHAVQVLAEREAREFFDQVVPWLLDYDRRAVSRSAG